jgi:hypothetical protein
LSLLAQETNSVEHLACPGRRRLEARPKPIVLALEIADPIGQVDAYRASLLTFDFLEPRFRLERAPPETGKLVRQMVNEHVQLLHGAVVSLSVV